MDPKTIKQFQKAVGTAHWNLSYADFCHRLEAVFRVRYVSFWRRLRIGLSGSGRVSQAPIPPGTAAARMRGRNA